MFNIYFLLQIPEIGQLPKNAAQLDWLGLIKDILLLLAAFKFIFDYFANKKKEKSIINNTDAGTNQILNNMIQVSNEQLQDWMNSALESARKIVELQKELGDANIKNGRLQNQIDDLKEFLNKSLDIIREAQVPRYNEFELEIQEILKG